MTTHTLSQSNSNTNPITIDWDDALTGNLPESPYRTAFRQAVAEMAESAKRALPNCASRIDSAVKIVLAGDVKLLEDGTARVASQSNGAIKYFIVNGECECKDFPKAPHGGWCKHRLAHALVKRAATEARKRLNGHMSGHNDSQIEPVNDQAEAATAPATEACTSLPEAPASCNVYVSLNGHRLQITLRDQDEERLLVRMQTLLARFPAPESAPQAQPTAAPAPATVEPPAPEGWCRLHEVQMQRWPGKDGRPAWWSHKIDGVWCKGKGR